MPVLPLKPFFAYKQNEFRIGGNPAEVFDFARRWRTFADNALTTAASLRTINDGGFLGSEGDRYRELVHGEFPQHLTITGESHGGVSTAVTQYAEALVSAQTQMNALLAVAVVDHTMVQTAVARYNVCEANLVRAAATAKMATATAIATAAVPGVNAATASAATAAQSDLAAAQAAFEAAKAEHLRATTTFDADVAKGASIKTALSTEVQTVVTMIRSQARKRFEENPNWLQAGWNDRQNWMRKESDDMGILTQILEGIGSMLTAIIEFDEKIEKKKKELIEDSKKTVWGKFVNDMLTSTPVTKTKNVLWDRPGYLLSERIDKATVEMHKYTPESLRKDNITKMLGMEPVDMATGEMVDLVTDIRIDGMLPMIVSRNNGSRYCTSMTFGPGWNSSLDTRIEILRDKILMLSPDGAILEFPPAPVDGSEVVADGKPWRLSFVDGAYRVRNIQEGITWVFAVSGAQDAHRPDAPVPDFTITGDAPKNYIYRVDEDTGEVTRRTRTADDLDEYATDDTEDSEDESRVWEISSSFVNVLSPGSVADTFGLGVEVLLSTVIHRSGAWIEYDYEQSTGHLITMRRSDGTTLEFKWHNRISRILSISVKNEETHPGEEPMRLISYNYDGKGRLLKVINSAAGVLRYYYDEESRPCRWTDRNGCSYFYRFDDQGRVVSQVGSGGMFPNVAVWLKDEGEDAPEDGVVCVALECAGEFHGDPVEVGDSCINDYFERLDKLPLANLLREKGLVGAGLIGRGRVGVRDDESWTIPEELLHDEFLGDIRPTVYRSTPAGDVWRVITPEGTVIDREYNQYHQVVKEISNTGVITTVDRDEYGTITQVDYGDGTTETVTPGAWGEPVRVVSRDGLTTEYELDSVGFVTAITDPTGAQLEYEYEWRASGLVPSAVIDSQGLVQVTECDNAGRPVALVDPVGRRSSVVRDVRGLVTEVMDPIGNVTTLEYSPEGWVTKIINPDGSEQSTSYDGEGNPIMAVNEAGAKTTAQYTVFDKLAEAHDVQGGVTKYSYNTQMEPVAITNADGHVWRFEYDLDGVVVKEIDYNGLITETRRSSNGLCSEFINGEGVVTAHYDIFGQLTELHKIDDVVRFARNELGKITQVSNKWSTIDYRHDEYGRPSSVITTLYSGEQSVVKHHYDITGEVDVVTHMLPDGREVTETTDHDEYGQLQRMTHHIGGQECAVTSFGVDNGGRRSWTAVGSIVRQFGFDKRNRLVSDTVQQLGAISPANNLMITTPSNMQTPMHDVINRVFSWRVDDVLEQVKDTVRDITIDYVVDSSGRVTGVTHTDAAQDQKSSESYEFSRAGMLTKLHPDTSAKWADDVDLYGGTMPRQIGRTSFTYDKAGRVIQTVTKRLSKKPLVKHFYYGSGTQPVGYEDSDHLGVGWRYLYDGLSRRVGKEQIDTATGDVLSRVVFMHQGNRLFGEQHTVNVHEPRLVGSGQLWPADPLTGDVMGQIEITVPSDSVDGWSQDQVDAVFYAMVSDLTGAPKELVDVTTGGIVGYSKQSLFGKRQWFGGKSSPLLFAGQYEDAESGWVYNRFRYYNAAFGMYNAQDPLGVGPNLASAQAYVDNPTTWVDVFGLRNCSKRERLHANKRRGDKGEETIHEILERERDLAQKEFPRESGVRERAYIEQAGVKASNGRNTITDFILTDGDGNYIVLDSKTGGADLSETQKCLKNDFKNNVSGEMRSTKGKKIGLDLGKEFGGEYHIIHPDTAEGREELRAIVRDFWRKD